MQLNNRRQLTIICRAPGLLMEPWDYCLVWVKSVRPSEHGFRAECVRELARATFGQYKHDTINRGWGAKFEKRPESVLKLLEVSHTLRTTQAKLVQAKASVAIFDTEITEMLNSLNKVIHIE